jgi:predicted  nucleic acid-binding Zn-ribbon protein
MPPEPLTVELAERMVRIETSIEALRAMFDASIESLRADLARYFKEYVDHETRIRALEKEVMTRYEARLSDIEKNVATQEERVKHLSLQTNIWDGLNSMGVLIGTFLGINRP